MFTLCECDGFCTLKIKISESDKKLRYFSMKKSLVVISDYCTHGPEPGDIVIKKGKGYMIYEEG